MNRIRFALSIMAFALPFLLVVDARAQSIDRTKTNRAKLVDEIQSLREQLQQKEQEFLSPSAKDRTAYAEFLRQPNTGLIRLLPREQYTGKLMVNGNGAYYSFTGLTNEYGQGSDIELDQNSLSVGFNGANFGFLTKLGDVPLETVTLDHPSVQFLAEFVTPLKEAEAREQYRRGNPGFHVNGVEYAGHVSAQANTTYALRSINYDSSDVLVAFRIVRQDADGSMVLLWKMMKNFPKPELNQTKMAN